ncbi:4,5-DOPA dioxygenase extradiol [Pelagicoccus sp. NFK12]|uniref:4,5-DOPA dioxygenase extradiol n=1 Tax=Pelagicoccus enzymogenes TaxID=2773457 RepID=A0A927FDA7_9BACT|nr:4,5-DOPA dioxygenase extradiol [Pelagicoccus enzymogenes]MBD5782299.1 4,5-DOPA dioxygenase extradiol [Pelagicoccus enzymogenes]
MRFQDLKDRFQASERMPVVFLGHGNPMNAIEDNQYSKMWRELGSALPRPQAILVVSAHWMTQGSTLVDISQAPRTIHDFGGFPRELYQQQYPASGDPKLAREVISLLESHHAEGDDSWGLDHGSWSVLKWLYPDADIPVFQLSIDMSKDLDWHLQIGRTLSQLRDRGVLILGSGNVVHNLGALRFDGGIYDWASEFDARFAQLLEERNLAALASRSELGSLFRQAHPTVDHYLPALSVAGASDQKDTLSFTSSNIEIGNISMRGFIFS